MAFGGAVGAGHADRRSGFAVVLNLDRRGRCRWQSAVPPLPLPIVLHSPLNSLTMAPEPNKLNCLMCKALHSTVNTPS